jgi:hypothetical protein
MNSRLGANTAGMGSTGFVRKSLEIATLTNGKRIKVDRATFTPASFRIFLENTLKRDDLTDESRKQILEALGTPKTEAELVLDEVGKK